MQNAKLASSVLLESRVLIHSLEFHCFDGIIPGFALSSKVSTWSCALCNELVVDSTIVANVQKHEIDKRSES